MRPPIGQPAPATTLRGEGVMMGNIPDWFMWLLTVIAFVGEYWLLLLVGVIAIFFLTRR